MRYVFHARWWASPRVKAPVSLLPSHGYILHTQARTPSGIQKLAKPTVQYLTIQSLDVIVTNRGPFFSPSWRCSPFLSTLNPNCLPLHLTHVPPTKTTTTTQQQQANASVLSHCWWPRPRWRVGRGEFCICIQVLAQSATWSFLFPNPQPVWNSPCFCSPVQFPPSSKCLSV